jgi:hypothetical protein
MRFPLWRITGVAVVGFVVYAACGTALPGPARNLSFGLIELSGPPPEPAAVGLVAVVFALALAAACYRPTWLVLRYADTLTHELGHALVAAALGGRPGAVSIRMDSSGLAQWSGNMGRIRRSVVALAGYLAPPLVGLSGLQSYRAGYSTLWLAVAAAVCLTAVLVLLRNLFGFIVAASVSAALVTVLTYLPDLAPMATVFASTVLVVSGARSALGHLRLRDMTGSDAVAVREALFIPARLVAAGQLVVAVALGAVGLARIVGLV